MRIAIVGAGPAGLTSAKQALALGHEVVVYESHAAPGGIWNPASGGAYPGVRMQSSRMSFPFSDFAPGQCAPFPLLEEVHGYLRDYADAFGVSEQVRYRHTVHAVVKRGRHWQVVATGPDGVGEERFDAVMLATGELWQARLPRFLPAAASGCQIFTPKTYRGPQALRGKRVLVVGGGVSGADIASELAGQCSEVHWSVRRKALFLPRLCGGHDNDALFSYAGRIATAELPYQDFLKLLARAAPEHMQMAAQCGMLPDDGFHHAVHVNDAIVPLVHAGQVRRQPAFRRFATDGAVLYADGSEGRYDAVVLCMGYAMPDYGYVDGFVHSDLYRHFIYRHDRTLAVINTPVDTEAFGTACPYFEAVAGWALGVITGRIGLPDAGSMARWCQDNMQQLHRKRFYDCWLETVALRLESGTLPDPAQAFASYWQVVASMMVPANLVPGQARTLPAPFDAELGLAHLKARLLASIAAPLRARLCESGQITPAEAAAADAIKAGDALALHLPYRMRNPLLSEAAQ